jgi:hypothetical protein
MNVNDGLKISHINSVLGDNKNRYQHGLTIAAGVLSTVAAVIHVIALPALSLYFFPLTSLSHSFGPLPVIVPNGKSIFIFAGSVAFSAASSVGVGFLLYHLLDKHVVQKKVDQFAKYMLGFTEHYESEYVVDCESIRSLIQKTDKTAQAELLAHMNFFQLKEARKFVSKEAFTAAIGANRDLVWTCALDALKHCRNPDELAQKIEDFRSMHSDKLFKICISAFRDLYESKPAFLDAFKDEESFVYELSEESKWKKRKPTSGTWDLLWDRSLQLNLIPMQIKLKEYAIDRFKEALKNPSELSNGICCR